MDHHARHPAHGRSTATVAPFYDLEEIQKLFSEAVLRGNSERAIDGVEQLNVARISPTDIDGGFQEIAEQAGVAQAVIRIRIADKLRFVEVAFPVASRTDSALFTLSPAAAHRTVTLGGNMALMQTWAPIRIVAGLL